MIPYIGDISSADAEVLKEMAVFSRRILEFGCGASTQVIAKYKKPETTFVSIDTSEEWSNKTMENIKLLNIDMTNVFFVDYYMMMSTLNDEDKGLDFIFDDGVDSLRREFAINIWPFLAPRGLLALHDTRRPHDFRNVLEILAKFQDEIGAVYFNTCGSNITTIQKVTSKPYDNWQITEKKEPWMLGYGEIPESYKKLMKKST